MALLTQIENENKVGYKDELGNIVIDPIYDEGQLFIGSYLSKEEVSYGSVMKNGRCGIIDQKGNVIVPFEYEEAYHLYNNLFAVRKERDNHDWAFGVIDSHGAIIIPFEYKLIRQKHNIIQCVVNANSKRIYSHCYMNTDGRVYEYYSCDEKVIWYNSSGIQIFNGEVISHALDYFVVRENEKLGVIDNYGNYVIQCLYTEIHCISKDCFVVRVDSDSSWMFGAITNCGKVIIDFIYKFISHESASFYECYREANCSLEGVGSFNYFNLAEPIWYNKHGIKVYEGKAKVLSDNFLAVMSNEKWGVVTQTNKKVVNFLYDSVSVIQDKIIVGKDAKIGLLEKDGSILIVPSYNKIECAYIDEKKYHGWEIEYGQYNKDCIFDTANEKSKILHVEISYNLLNNARNITVENESKFNFEKLFILYGESYCELFSAKNGIVANSRFDIIRKLTDVLFAVRKQGKWGIFCGNTGQTIIPCEYDRIVYEGGLVALLCKNELWGAKTIMPLDNMSYQLLNVDIPVSFKEIKILDKAQQLFGVRRERTDFKESLIEDYTIVDNKGGIYDGMSKIFDLDKQCVLFDSNYDRILASRKGKYGFISTKGYVTIPFHFDCVEKREDGYFNIKVNNAWGVLDISGREIVGIKYTNKLPLKFADEIVKNSSTGRYGILAEDGSERIPSVYEHLRISDNFIYFGYNGYELTSSYNFFSNIEGATWGVMNIKGEVLIDATYDCYKKRDGFILAGRNGMMLYDDGYGRNYSGVYDLYSSLGELLFGGFSEFIFDAENEIYIFFLGGKWEIRHTSLGDVHAHSHYFNRGVGQWLFLDKNLKSIKRNSDGKQIVLKRGAICRIEIKQQENKRIYMYNMPIDIMAKGFERISYGNIIIADSNDKENQKFAALNIRTGEETPFYQRIEFIDNSKFFFSEGDRVGVREYKKIIIEPECLFITNPVNGFYFVAKENDDNFSNLVLCSINDENFQLVAIEKINTSKLVNMTVYGKLKIESDIDGTSLDSIYFSELSIFDNSFVNLVSKKESGLKYEDIFRKHKEIYWFSSDYRMKENDSTDDYDDSDYARDRWDAMTDGMYGDMPDGFDGDYGFMGY